MGTRKELVSSSWRRASPRDDRGAILDELVATTGYHRKHAIRLLGADKERAPRTSSRRYREPVKQALAVSRGA